MACGKLRVFTLSYFAMGWVGLGRAEDKNIAYGAKKIDIAVALSFTPAFCLIFLESATKKCISVSI